MASFFQSKWSSPSVSLRGVPSIPGVDFHAYKGLQRSASPSPRVSCEEGEAQRGKVTSPGSHKEAAEGRIRTRAPGCCICLSPPSSAGRISHFSGPVGPSLSFSYTYRKLHRQANYLLIVGPKGPIKLQSTIPAIPAKPCTFQIGSGQLLPALL